MHSILNIVELLDDVLKKPRNKKATQSSYYSQSCLAITTKSHSKQTIDPTVAHTQYGKIAEILKIRANQRATQKVAK